MHIKEVPAIVTGGASGLGAATSRALAALGAKVAFFDLDDEAGAQLAGEIGGRYFHVDVRRESEVDFGLDQAEKVHGAARICVNCAGIAPAMKVVSRQGTAHPLENFRNVIDINLIGTFIVLSQFAARLARTPPIGEERGVIVNTASIAAFEGQIGHAAYSASKSGIVGMTLPIARELADFLIRVVTIAPGIFSTGIVAGLAPAIRESVEKQVPHPRRYGAPREFADLVVAIIQNPMLNGETIRLDGALRLTPR